MKSRLYATTTPIALAALSLLPNIVPDSAAQSLEWEAYDPPSSLVVPEHIVTRARFPFIDVHSHQWQMDSQNLTQLATEMDAMNMAIMVNLSGRGGSRLKAMTDNVAQHYPNRFVVFTNLDFNNVDQADWKVRTLAQLQTDFENGAKGLKIFKGLGMSNTDTKGNRIAVDDPRLGPVWDKCGELGIPVLIHSADPKQFWLPQDEQNERWLELKTHPRRKRSDTDPAPWAQIMSEQHRMFKAHPKTQFIAAHMGWHANDLDKLGQLLDEIPNMHVGIAAVIAELGRQPRAANRFFEKYQDRVLFGKDAYHPQEFHTYFRVLETDDEYFPYYKRYHAFWRMYGLDLPDEILKKLYYQNALNLIPGLDASLFPE
ncbi:amidohydrolase family protein [Pelagicoccus sp. SDUM812002]|uniref:amidohydrolase family protein n=1 Tax=Pelagicoccus sp. SDUM812002 TaxID=3041266 RepID=UPI00280E4789|nr:amidohydrolase family protein [Pelagicoccus sp. SDUM812002]MDQ8185597.1 amidohydrolase family protein [Pelagicoccus sp. SDUM812002]